MKGKIRAMRRAFSQNRMIAAAGEADVLIVNPTHFAVAVKYDRSVGVPVVLARGSDKIALRMREVAKESSVPVIEEKPLARALYWSCEVGDSVPRELFEGVARVLAFVYALVPSASRRDSYQLPMSVASSIPAASMGPGARKRVKADARRARSGARKMGARP
jgi:flagellar biosynthesis protein FlhB